uniref:LNS2/PITP domain-containing protein n=1 Tax=Chromera velia CCMP2878 TaxID=1169474 RepID=A0A0G4H2E2_9ALVE|eukprot:Cvel_24403.t1-p1 / transcript=Cvel_24403.t1 / gene=Cvel_24403 / organism=Chromera_velia_CCMP2878 / gene_product=Nuclear elongation and deformation protein 1, putative / transcript_product=Nuclear elongation and deformation protein 1, putative / location=Cvel_scaffold2633:5209-12236(+) / protein_length=1386 / sequence_SO=supercontig / SO=protein_coding / is_pseudo=false
MSFLPTIAIPLPPIPRVSGNSSGAVDVVIVRDRKRPWRWLACTDFNVRFGRYYLPNGYKGEPVEILINGEPTGVKMKACRRRPGDFRFGYKFSKKLDRPEPVIPDIDDLPVVRFLSVSLSLSREKDEEKEGTGGERDTKSSSPSKKSPRVSDEEAADEEKEEGGENEEDKGEEEENAEEGEEDESSSCPPVRVPFISVWNHQMWLVTKAVAEGMREDLGEPETTKNIDLGEQGEGGGVVSGRDGCVDSAGTEKAKSATGGGRDRHRDREKEGVESQSVAVTGIERERSVRRSERSISMESYQTARGNFLNSSGTLDLLGFDEEEPVDVGQEGGEGVVEEGRKAPEPIPDMVAREGEGKTGEVLAELVGPVVIQTEGEAEGEQTKIQAQLQPQARAHPPTKEAAAESEGRPPSPTRGSSGEEEGDGEEAAGAVEGDEKEKEKETAPEGGEREATHQEREGGDGEESGWGAQILSVIGRLALSPRNSQSGSLMTVPPFASPFYEELFYDPAEEQPEEEQRAEQQGKGVGCPSSRLSRENTKTLSSSNSQLSPLPGRSHSDSALVPSSSPSASSNVRGERGNGQSDGNGENSMIKISIQRGEVQMVQTGGERERDGVGGERAHRGPRRDSGGVGGLVSAIRCARRRPKDSGRKSGGGRGGSGGGQRSQGGVTSFMSGVRPPVPSVLSVTAKEVGEIEVTGKGEQQETPEGKQGASGTEREKETPSLSFSKSPSQTAPSPSEGSPPQLPLAGPVEAPALSTLFQNFAKEGHGAPPPLEVSLCRSRLQLSDANAAADGGWSLTDSVGEGGETTGVSCVSVFENSIVSPDRLLSNPEVLFSQEALFRFQGGGNVYTLAVASSMLFVLLASGRLPSRQQVEDVRFCPLLLQPAEVHRRAVGPGPSGSLVVAGGGEQSGKTGGEGGSRGSIASFLPVLPRSLFPNGFSIFSSPTAAPAAAIAEVEDEFQELGATLKTATLPVAALDSPEVAQGGESGEGGEEGIEREEAGSEKGAEEKEEEEEEDSEALRDDWDALPEKELTKTPPPRILRKIAAKLRPGYNKITFRIEGSEDCLLDAGAFYWDSSAKVVVSDIDGTVTVSDLTGHAVSTLGMVHKDHAGLPKVYRQIRERGYKLMYLSSRSLGQANTTRRYLREVCQVERGKEDERHTLPPGPVLVSANGMWATIRHEAFKTSDVFKVSCLQNVREAFPPNVRGLAPPPPLASAAAEVKSVSSPAASGGEPVGTAAGDAGAETSRPIPPGPSSSSVSAGGGGQGEVLVLGDGEVLQGLPGVSSEEGEEERKFSQIFMGGFGNRDTDVKTYRTLGVPPEKNFMIDPASDLCSQDRRQQKFRFHHLEERLDALFPAVAEPEDERDRGEVTWIGTDKNKQPRPQII